MKKNEQGLVVYKGTPWDFENQHQASLNYFHLRLISDNHNKHMFVFPRYTGRANHWSALIGASHSKSYMLWEYGGYASEGVRQVAEFGSPIRMEEEIRQKVGQAQKRAFIIDYRVAVS